MRLGFCGAHRTGKSTLMNIIAERHGIDRAASSMFPAAKSMGLDMSKPHGFDVRIRYQTAVLDAMENVYGAHPAFVSDRTPLDAAAYLLADVQTTTGDAELQEQANQYVDRALRLTDRLFDVVILVPPGIDVEPVDGKPPVNPAYQEHIHFLVRGIMSELTIPHGTIERDNLDLEDRVLAVQAFASVQLRKLSIRRAVAEMRVSG